MVSMNADTTLLEHEVNEWREFAKANVYSTQTRPRFKAIKDRICMLFPDYRRYIVSNAKVAELPVAIIRVADRTLEQLERQKIAAQAETELVRQRLLNQLKANQAQRLMDEVAPHRLDYINGFDDPEEGVQAWSCLVTLILEGDVTREQLPDYGIQL